MARPWRLALLLFFFSFLFCSITVAAPLPKEAAIMQLSLDGIERWHYNPAEIDDAFSRSAHKAFIERLDPAKQFFTQVDLDALAEYETEIDDDIKTQNDVFFSEAVTRFKRRVAEVSGFYEGLIDGSFDYSQDDALQLNAEQRSAVADSAALKAHWKQYIRYLLMESQFDLFKDAHKGKSENPDSMASLPRFRWSAEREKEAKLAVRKRLKRRFKRLKDMKRSDYFNSYMTAVTRVFDPHTLYFPSEDKEDFDISLSGKLEGIGAILNEEDGYVSVVRLIPGGPAWRDGRLEAKDSLLAVADNGKEPVDLVGMLVGDAVRFIRGKKGTPVTLTVKKADGTVQDIALVRDVVVVEDSYAKGAVLEDSSISKGKIGYIYLPSFYRDFSDSHSRNATDDVGRLLSQFKEAEVDGVILDLRSNGGGSLQDAVGVTGHFITEGPVVQVRHPDEKVEIRSDTDGVSLYDGPLVVMVNSFSASASEILSAAIQDYKRGVIIGSEHSFGKGTVQTFMDLDRFLSLRYKDLKPLGSLKLTIQTFYRVTGGTTQFRGVIPDIVLPSTTDYLDIGEGESEHALPWTSIRSVRFTPWSRFWDLGKVKAKSAERVASNSIFSSIRDYTDAIRAERNEAEPLNLDKAWSMKMQREARSEAFDALLKESKTLDVSPFYPVLTESAEQEEKWLSDLKKDFMLGEAMAVLGDLQQS